MEIMGMTGPDFMDPKQTDCDRQLEYVGGFYEP